MLGVAAPHHTLGTDGIDPIDQRAQLGDGDFADVDQLRHVGRPGGGPFGHRSPGPEHHVRVARRRIEHRRITVAPDEATRRCSRVVRQVGLGEQQQVRGGELCLHGVGNEPTARQLDDLVGIDRHHDAVEQEPGGVRPRSHSRRLGDTAQLHHHLVGRVHPGGHLPHLFEHRAEIVSDCAAHAAVAERQRLPVVVGDQRGVDADRTDVVDQHHQPTIRRREQAIHERRLAGAEIPAEEGERQRTGIGHAGRVTSPPTTVPCTWMSLIAIGSTAFGSSSSATKSASLPASIAPSS